MLGSVLPEKNNNINSLLCILIIIQNGQLRLKTKAPFMHWDTAALNLINTGFDRSMAKAQLQYRRCARSRVKLNYWVRTVVNTVVGKNDNAL